MQIKYIKPFIDATANVFKEFVGISATAGKPFVFKASEGKYNYDISAIIGIAGQTMGIVVVSFPKITALKVASIMMQEEIKIFDDSIIDIVGEIVNIIAGNAKKGLEEFKLAISLPSIVKGPKHHISGVSNVPLIGIPFESEKGEFYLFVSLKDLISA